MNNRKEVFVNKEKKSTQNSSLTVSQRKKNQSRELGKLGRQGAICRLKKELFWRLGTLHIFFRNSIFLNVPPWPRSVKDYAILAVHT